ncbi:Protein mex-isoform a, partial [Globisporangium splendens]
MEPIAKRLKQSAESALVTKKPKNEEEDIAERIKRLEAELDGSGSSSGSDDESSDSDDDDNDEEKEPAVLNLSKYASERIEALPEELLPAKRAIFVMKSEKKPKKRKQPDANEASITSSHQAILDLVQMPKKIPFACKRCAFIGKDLDDFNAHRQSPEHLAKQQVQLCCALCDKSFTSQAQLDEHKTGKWHLQRAQKKKERHVVRICYDFMRGSCFRGDRCGFDHTETKAMKTGKALDKKKQRVCDQFAKARSCRFGDKCLFSHESS